MDENLNLNGNTEIEKALKELELKSNTEQIQKPTEVLKHEVEGVKFETPSYGAGKFCHGADTPKMVQIAVKWSGGCLDQRQAEYIIIGMSVFVFSLSVYIFWNTIVGEKPTIYPGLIIPQDIVNTPSKLQ